MFACLAGILVALGGCATGPTAVARDPFEPVNRQMMKVNDVFDAVLLKPAATIYREVVPPLARTGVSNIYGNMTDIWSFVNSLLQLKIQNAADNFARVQLNTFFGLGGIFDIASEFNIDRHREDLGQTLGHWGFASGPYLVLPFFGPSTLRDTIALPLDRRADPLHYVDPWGLQGALVVLRAVDVRHNLLRTSSVLEEAALDKYSFTRDAYLQRRRSEIYEDNPSDDGGKEPKEDGGKQPNDDAGKEPNDDAGKEPKNGEPAPKSGAPAQGAPDTSGAPAPAPAR
jgi:phospholipid-binding lipoprotein MlaA